MTDLYSSAAMERLRRLLGRFRRSFGLSVERLAHLLSANSGGPSTSTLNRFLGNGSDAGAGELSLRHADVIVAGLRDFIQMSEAKQETITFIRDNSDDLSFFGILRSGETAFSRIAVQSAAEMMRDRATTERICGSFLIVRSLGAGRFMISIAKIESDLVGSSLICKIFRSYHDQTATMQCDLLFLNGLIYMFGLNPLNKTIRQICLLPADTSGHLYTGHISGFENSTTSFASKALLLRTTPEFERVQAMKYTRRRLAVMAFSRLLIFAWRPGP